MSSKTIKGPKAPLAVGGVPKELVDVPSVLKLSKARGNENYSLALQCLVTRFAESEYARKSGKPPHQLVLESIHSLINILNEVFPRSSSNRPLGIPEVALLFGAVVGTAASPTLVHGEVTVAEIEAQVELFWVALREWLAKGYFAVKHIESSGAMNAAASKIILPPGGGGN